MDACRQEGFLAARPAARLAAQGCDRGRAAVQGPALAGNAGRLAAAALGAAAAAAGPAAARLATRPGRQGAAPDQAPRAPLADLMHGAFPWLQEGAYPMLAGEMMWVRSRHAGGPYCSSDPGMRADLVHGQARLGQTSNSSASPVSVALPCWPCRDTRAAATSGAGAARWTRTGRSSRRCTTRRARARARSRPRPSTPAGSTSAAWRRTCARSPCSTCRASSGPRRGSFGLGLGCAPQRELKHARWLLASQQLAHLGRPARWATARAIGHTWRPALLCGQCLCAAPRGPCTAGAASVSSLPA